MGRLGILVTHRHIWKSCPPTPVAPSAMSVSPSNSSSESPLQEILPLAVDRSNVVLTSFPILYYASPLALRLRLHVTFQGEAGIDSGGLTKDWLLLFSKGTELFTP